MENSINKTIDLSTCKTILTLEHGNTKCSNETPQDTDMYELLDSFIGACVSVGFHIEIVNSVLEDYVLSVKEEKEDEKTN